MPNNNGDLMENKIIRRDKKCPLLTIKNDKSFALITQNIAESKL